MKLLLILVILNSEMVFAHGGEVHSKQELVVEKDDALVEAYKSINLDYQDRVRPIFQAKCFDCHSSATNYPWYYKIPIVNSIIDSHIKEAKSHIDMSKDFPFEGHGEPAKDLKAIIKVTENDKMPPWYYTPFHAQSKLTISEKEFILNWSLNSLEKLQQEK